MIPRDHEKGGVGEKKKNAHAILAARRRSRWKEEDAACLGVGQALKKGTGGPSALRSWSSRPQAALLASGAAPSHLPPPHTHTHRCDSARSTVLPSDRFHGSNRPQVRSQMHESISPAAAVTSADLQPRPRQGINTQARLVNLMRSETEQGNKEARGVRAGRVPYIR